VTIDYGYYDDTASCDPTYFELRNAENHVDHHFLLNDVITRPKKAV